MFHMGSITPPDTFCIALAHFMPIVGVNCSMVKPEKAAPVTGTTLRTTGPEPADSRD